MARRSHKSRFEDPKNIWYAFYFPAQSDLDLFIGPIIEKETCRLELVGML
jgi:hypothetical protein